MRTSFLHMYGMYITHREGKGVRVHLGVVVGTAGRLSPCRLFFFCTAGRAGALFLLRRASDSQAAGQGRPQRWAVSFFEVGEGREGPHYLGFACLLGLAGWDGYVQQMDGMCVLLL